MPTYVIQHLDPEDWERVRAIRHRALADSPDAFGTTLREDEARPAASWQQRLTDPEAATFLAVVDGHDVGMVVGAPYRTPGGSAGLFGMWVEPAHRGTGIAAALVKAHLAWAREHGYRQVLLDVADTNAAAVRFYARMGFRPNGVVGSLPPPREHIREHQRVLEL